jgi:serine/threonine protein kinase
MVRKLLYITLHDTILYILRTMTHYILMAAACRLDRKRKFNEMADNPRQSEIACMKSSAARCEAGVIIVDEASAIGGAMPSSWPICVKLGENNPPEIVSLSDYEEGSESGEIHISASHTETPDHTILDSPFDEHWFDKKVADPNLLISLPEKDPTGVPYPLVCLSPIRASDTEEVIQQKQLAHAAFDDPYEDLADYFHHNLKRHAEERAIYRAAIMEQYNHFLPKHIENEWKASDRWRRCKNGTRIDDWQFERDNSRAKIMARFGVSRDSLIGSGGFGKVYAFKCNKETYSRLTKRQTEESKSMSRLDPDSDLVVKIGTAGENAPEKAWYRRFQREQTPCQQLVKFFDIGGPDDRHFTTICLERANSGCLAKLIYKSETISEQTIWKLILDVSAALSYLHEGCLPEHPKGRPGWSSIIHNDLKPANILCKVDKDGNLSFVVTDFGLTTFEPTAGNKPGTPEYLHPEYPAVVTRAFDIWSLGCIVHEVITQQLPRYNVTAMNGKKIHPCNLRCLLRGTALYNAISEQPVRPIPVHLPPQFWYSNEQFVTFHEPEWSSVSKALCTTMYGLLSGQDTRPTARWLHQSVARTINKAENKSWSVALKRITCDQILQEYVTAAEQSFEREMSVRRLMLLGYESCC